MNSGFAPLASSSFFGSRLNLDLDSSRFPGGDSSLRINKEKLDYAYNDYIQALAKKRIISTSFKDRETLLQQQLNYQHNKLMKMKEDCEQKKATLESLVRSNELVNILKKLYGKLEEFENLTGSQNINRLMNLSNMLEIAAKNCMLDGVKSLKNREEWLSLLKVMDELCKALQTFFESHKSIKEFELIDEISRRHTETLELQKSIQEKIVLNSSLSKTASIKYLEKMKDLCDILGNASI